MKQRPTHSASIWPPMSINSFISSHRGARNTSPWGIASTGPSSCRGVPSHVRRVSARNGTKPKDQLFHATRRNDMAVLARRCWSVTTTSDCFFHARKPVALCRHASKSGAWMQDHNVHNLSHAVLIYPASVTFALISSRDASRSRSVHCSTV